MAAYLVFTAMTTVKQLPGVGRRTDGVLMLLAFAFAAVLLAAVGDLRAIRSGGLAGPRRLARHLWRTCFGLFVATGSFFLGQMKFIPERVRSMPVLLALALAPIPLLPYWMWRVRVRGRMSGFVVGVRAVPPPQPRSDSVQ